METEFDFRKGQLLAMFNKLNASIGSREKKYFHLNTIENLIFHFTEIKTENDKNWVYETLQEYLKKCFDLLPSIDRSSSKNLFYSDINKLTNYYHDNLGFKILINRSIVYFVYFIVLVACYIFFNIYVVIAVASLFVIQIFTIFKKYKERKVYGLFW